MKDENAEKRQSVRSPRESITGDLMIKREEVVVDKKLTRPLRGSRIKMTEGNDNRNPMR